MKKKTFVRYKAAFLVFVWVLHYSSSSLDQAMLDTDKKIVLYVRSVEDDKIPTKSESAPIQQQDFHFLIGILPSPTLNT